MMNLMTQILSLDKYLKTDFHLRKAARHHAQFADIIFHQARQAGLITLLAYPKCMVNKMETSIYYEILIYEAF